jgi:LCP family protein required for cell wall assembly
MPSLYADMPSDLEQRPYKLYRSGPKGLMVRLRGEEDDLQVGRAGPEYNRYRAGGRESRPRRRITPKRVILGLVIALAGWLLLSLVLFLISSSTAASGVPADAEAALTSGGNMVTSTDNVLVIGTDQRPAGTHEAGANTSDAGSRSDTLMLWRVGGGVSRRLSIPRDTLVPIPGHGTNKINAAYAFGGPALTIKTVEQFARSAGVDLAINHVIIINFANFPKFIDAIGGVTVKTGRICSQISGGAQNGGWTLNLAPGVHHLDGTDALTLARTRENSCNPASTDLTREGYQQQILNGIKSQLLSASTFFHLPWASWYAPQAIRTDMGGLTLLSMFAGTELGGSAPVQILKPTGGEVVPGVGDALTVTTQAAHQDFSNFMNG